MKKRRLKINLLVLTVVLLLSLVGCSSPQEKTQITDNTSEGSIEKSVVAVAIVPQETFVKAIAGDKVDVVTMIPPGHSPTNYQPTPQQMMEFSEASIYFSMGVPTEKANILPKVKNLNKNIEIVKLDEIVAEVYPNRYFGEDEEHNHEGEEDNQEHGENARDPHIWMSPKRVKVMIETIKDELIELDPQNKSIYEANASEYIDKLDKVDQRIVETLEGADEQSFIVYHPSFGYFADDYGLNMVPIEENGKEATVRRIQEIIDFAKGEDIRFVFYQAEFDSSQAESIAKEIDGGAVKVAPLAPDYIENLKGIADTFKEVLK